MSDEELKIPDKQKVSYRAFADQVKSAVNTIQQKFTDPEDDFIPIVQFSNGEDVSITPIPGEMLNSEEAKNILMGTVIPEVAKKTGTTMVATVFSAWTATYDKDTQPEDEGFVPPSENENRQEMVVVTVIDRERAEVHTAFILRDGEHPPGLTDWEVYTDQIEGRMVEPIQEALR